MAATGITDEQIIGLLTRLAESLEDLGDEVQQLRVVMARSKHDDSKDEGSVCSPEHQHHDEGEGGADNPDVVGVPGRSASVEVGDGEARLVGTLESGTPDC